MTNVIKVIIPAGGNTSQIVDLTSYKHLQIYMPSAWTTAAISFITAPDDMSTFQSLIDDVGVEVSIGSGVAVASKSISIDVLATSLASVTLCKFVSGLSGSEVSQTAEAIIKIIAKD